MRRRFICWLLAATLAGCVQGKDRPLDGGLAVADAGPEVSLSDGAHRDGRRPDAATPDADRGGPSPEAGPTPDACLPESSAAFCQRLGKDCGTVEARDSCGKPRKVPCGSCTAPKLCGGAGVPNRCDTCQVPAAKASCSGGLCEVPAGCFQMGSPAGETCREPDSNSSRETLHRVLLTHPFRMHRLEVTQHDFNAKMGYNPAAHTSSGPTMPVEYVSWHEAAAYCNSLTATPADRCYACVGAGKDVRCSVPPAHKGAAFYRCKGFRLPSEAEWEYAYRAGTTTALYNGALGACKGQDPNADAIGYYRANSALKLQAGGQLKPNAWGLYDMAGNLWEWCHDAHSADLGSAPVTDPVRDPSLDPTRMVRGGSFEHDPQYIRAAHRYFGYAPHAREVFIGFRCVQSR